ncbi:mRNA triphosphatase CET1 [Cucurbitaria berberidis CBS 394.84]|uniref:mRNA-capping enzyme subunit beta n=1 Tax=Cucurbitaria berberidis CBS 394.84 TaxID=1168544 RepID=A0A9P4G9Q1_9PLEO|nr:mRNA triphosphatase CET1 [Cucurbitaria berberidis CBS 394.84]KAF1841451.1 mRNA triphosphatase CET1 [Cucurbitaria berberidis CBS 394.84]
MDISALVNHDTEAAVPPRRSLSNPHSLSAPIPSAASISTPPKPTHKPMPPLKRKRHDPKPIWAYREGEELPPELKQQEEQRQQPRLAPPPATQPQPQPQPHGSPIVQRNGAPPSAIDGPSEPVIATGLAGFERPISDDAHVYDDVSRKVCDFIWVTAVNNELVRNAIADPLTQLEVEARWGHIIDRRSDQRFRGYHDSECVIKTDNMEVKFESTMTIEQHKRMNMYLNGQVQKAKAPGASRASVEYQHTKEVDIFYELDQQGFLSLNPIVQRLINQSGTRQRIRVTKDAKTGNLLRAIIKHRIGNLEISSPQTEWDYRIGINLEIDFPGPIENLQPAVEPGKTPESMQRHKDRISYSWLGAYQVDLTQVTQGQNRNHELELELDAGVLIDNADKVRQKAGNSFEGLITGMMNNLRVLSREITPPAPGT